MPLADVDECVVCLAEIDDPHIAKELGCGHCFHLECILQWGAGSRRCPLCRLDFTADFPEAVDIGQAGSLAADTVLHDANAAVRAAVEGFNAHANAGSPGPRSDLDAIVSSVVRALVWRQEAVEELAWVCSSATDLAQRCRRELTRMAEDAGSAPASGWAALHTAFGELVTVLSSTTSTENAAALIRQSAARLPGGSGNPVGHEVLTEVVSALDDVRLRLIELTDWCTVAAEDNSGVWDVVRSIAAPLGLTAH
ncbi:hypothetical protein UK23_38295 [Lentzea aerocolonigenes]|uniref:RING-type domain-containing protein n=1 Tax=Lentzea aerocolonigenes TaxID=68170 RepID=A0A0F0GF41_LENAE|nr:RING finger protein [Lentzea aerocolonigenes]KJK42189.1 hypothetical protein UK23_38295 [Lentzea aerocolonigenes]